MLSGCCDGWQWPHMTYQYTQRPSVCTKKSLWSSFCIEHYVLVTHYTTQNVFLYASVVWNTPWIIYPLKDLVDRGRTIFTCSFNNPISSHFTQVIQQALNRQPSTAAAQYLQQMYAAQQQHLMLQTAALQQQHLNLAAVQQVGTHLIDMYSGIQKPLKIVYLVYLSCMNSTRLCKTFSSMIWPSAQ